ncbi:MAG: MarR family transcriptional regulator [Peptococcaceae bacterium]|nr:MarR family transcriptional regulator [Peptococcaceae bacterium]
MDTSGAGRTNHKSGWLIKQISDTAAKHANNSLREKNLTFTQVRVLMMLYGSETTPLKEIERWLQVAQPSVAGVVSRLKAKGLIEVQASTEDSRMKLVKLTDDGNQYVIETRRDIERVAERMFAGFSEEEKDTLDMLLLKICENLK